MKKNVLFILATIVCACMISCNNGDKATPRVDVWGSDTASISVKVPFHRHDDNKLAEVQVSLNGVPFNMWWDTGASMTCISFLELQKLVKEGKVELEDYTGSSVTSLADGSQAEGHLFNIKEVTIQGKDNKDLILSDILVYVVENEEAPSLIGQNIINRLPKHSFNESNGTIEFY